MKGVFAKFGNDVIVNCAFGIECSTFKFRIMGKQVFNCPLGRFFWVSKIFPLLIDKKVHRSS